MIVTMYQGYDESYVILGSKNKEFQKNWGATVKTSTRLLFKTMTEIASFANNELNEECLFEVE